MNNFGIYITSRFDLMLGVLFMPESTSIEVIQLPAIDQNKSLQRESKGTSKKSWCFLVAYKCWSMFNSQWHRSRIC
ncbi:rCG63660 [Rattus norvegicus]|uniref:RCG63660 n=1 Tax=Rattus norvegicus TaxID=10116 RepID=A6IXN2_RAT|nr:rCG63660 [Rattus norvegicus]